MAEPCDGPSSPAPERVPALEALRERARHLFEDKPAPPPVPEPDPRIAEEVNRLLEETASDPVLRKLDEAHRKEQAADWTGAEQSYRDAIPLAASQHAGMRAQPLLKLSDLLMLLDRPAEALEFAHLGLELVRGWDCSPMLRHTLERVTRIALAQQDVASAETAIHESLNLPDATASEHLMTARARVQQARCQLLHGDVQAALTQLDAAWPVFSAKKDEHFLGGYQSGLANWWETMAQARRMQGNLPGAIEALREAVRRRQILTELPHLTGPYPHAALAKTLQLLAQALADHGQTQTADAFFSQSDGVRNSVGLPPLARS